MPRIGSGVLLLALMAASQVCAAPSPILIETGPVAGFAYPLGGEICRLYEKQAPSEAHCAAEVTDGSIENLNRLRRGDVALAIVQSDAAADALAGSGAFAGAKPFVDLRAVAGFYTQLLTILVKNDGPVKTIDDLKSKRVAVGETGNPDPLFIDFLEGLGWSKADLGGVVEMPRAEQINALCSGGVSAVAITAPHPNGFIREAMAACGVTVLDLAGPGIDTTVAQHPAYAPGWLELGVYGGPSHRVQSFGTRAVLVTTATFDDDALQRILKAVTTHVDDLRSAHPAFAGVDAGAISSSAGLGVERHPAAIKFFSNDKTADPGNGG